MWCIDTYKSKWKYRSHFGSRYTLGWCIIAGLLCMIHGIYSFGEYVFAYVSSTCESGQCINSSYIPSSHPFFMFSHCWNPKVPQKLWKSHWCVPFTATFSKRRKIGALWSERCDAKIWTWACLTNDFISWTWLCVFPPCISYAALLAEARKLTASREILLWMTPSEAPKALQASECSELLDPMRASCWISAQH